MKNARLGVWLSLIIPTFAWFAQFNIGYLLAAYSCDERVWLLHMVSLLAIVISAISIFVGWRSWRSLKEDGSWFLGILAFGGLIFLIIVFGEYSILVLEPCQ